MSQRTNRTLEPTSPQKALIIASEGPSTSKLPDKLVKVLIEGLFVHLPLQPSILLSQLQKVLLIKIPPLPLPSVLRVVLKV